MKKSDNLDTTHVPLTRVVHPVLCFLQAVAENDTQFEHQQTAQEKTGGNCFS